LPSASDVTGKTFRRSTEGPRKKNAFRKVDIGSSDTAESRRTRKPGKLSIFTGALLGPGHLQPRVKGRRNKKYTNEPRARCDLASAGEGKGSFQASDGLSRRKFGKPHRSTLLQAANAGQGG